MVGGRIVARQISAEEAKKIRSNIKAIYKIAKCGVVAGVLGAAVSGAVNYFGGEGYREFADQIFQYGGITILGSAALAFANSSSWIVGEEVKKEEPKSKLQLILDKTIF